MKLACQCHRIYVILFPFALHRVGAPSHCKERPRPRLEHGAAANQPFILSPINIAVASRRISYCMRRRQLLGGLKNGFEFGKVVVLSLASVSRPYLNCPSASARCPPTLPLVQQVQPHMNTVDTVFRPLWIGIYRSWNPPLPTGPKSCGASM